MSDMWDPSTVFDAAGNPVTPDVSSGGGLSQGEQRAAFDPQVDAYLKASGITLSGPTAWVDRELLRDFAMRGLLPVSGPIPQQNVVALFNSTDLPALGHTIPAWMAQVGLQPSGGGISLVPGAANPSFDAGGINRSGSLISDMLKMAPAALALYFGAPHLTEALGGAAALSGELGAGLGSAGSSIEAAGFGAGAGGELAAGAASGLPETAYLSSQGAGLSGFAPTAAVGTTVPTTGLEAMISNLAGGGALTTGGLGTLGQQAGLTGALGTTLGGADALTSIIQGTPIPNPGTGLLPGQTTSTGTPPPLGTVASALNKAFGTNLSDADVSVIGKLLGGGLGVAGALATGDKQQDAFSSLQNNLLGLGAPYRASLASLESNPTAFMESPEVQGAVQQGTNALARSLSATVGNPFNNPTALQELQNYATTANLGQLNQRRNFLLNASNLGLGPSTQAGMQAAGLSGQGTGNVLNALGSTVASVFNKDPYEELRQIMKDVLTTR